MKKNNTQIFDEYESEVRSYIRSFPVVFDEAVGSVMVDEDGKEYIDFFAGAGALNYGHNPEGATEAMIEYLKRRGIVHGLDKATVAKREFMEAFNEKILFPRGLEYKYQFVGPTGTNCTETAMKLARIVTQRTPIVAFTNGYHGHTMGALAVTGNADYQNAAYGTRGGVHHLPFEGFGGDVVDSLGLFRAYLEDNGSGIEKPAAVIVETIQGEGGVNIASAEWLQGLEKICREFGILLIIDDVQVGNGRTGEYFSFEDAGIKPDIVCLAKSIGGGLPMALLLFRPGLDEWAPGEHTGTFRGNNLAFVASKHLIDQYWSDDKFSKDIKRKSKIMGDRLNDIVSKYPSLECKVRGRGMIWGIEIDTEGFADKISTKAFEQNLIAETSGVADQVVKLLPALTIEDKYLNEGLDRLEKAFEEAYQEEESSK